MGAFKPAVFDAAQINKTPSSPTDAVRLTDLQTALSDVPTVGQMESAIAYVAQPPTQIATDASLLLSTLSPNNFNLKVNPSGGGILQAAQNGLEGTHSVVSLWEEITLGFQQVTNVVVTRNLISNDSVTFTGVAGVDYYLDAFDGSLTIPPNSGLINSGESPQITEIKVAFDCNEIDEGSGLQTVSGSSGGLGVNFGTGHNQAAYGDVVENLETLSHLAAAPDPAAQTTTTTIDQLQRIRVEVNLVPGGGIDKSSSGALQVDLATITSAVESAIPNASSSTTGFMTPPQVTLLGELANEQDLNFETTTSIALIRESDGNVTGTLLTGFGLTVGYVSVTGNSASGLFDDQNIWYNLSLSAATWPAGWPNLVYWGITITSGTLSFVLSSDSAGLTVLATGTVLVAALTSPQVVTLFGLSSNNVGNVTINTTTAYPVGSGQAIVLTAIGAAVDTTVVALKSTTDSQQAQLNTLESQSSSTTALAYELESDLATLGANLLTPDSVNDFGCLTALLEKWEYAHRFVSTLRLENPAIGAVSGGAWPTPAMIPIRQIIASGLSSNVYTVDLQISGVARVRNVWPGTAGGPGEVIPGTGGRAVKNGTPYVITLSSINSVEEESQDPFIQQVENELGEMIALQNLDCWTLTISDDGSGNPAVYTLNSSISNTEATGAPQALSYVLPNVTIKGGATITLQTQSVASAVSHAIVVATAPPYPLSYAGYFMQVDAMDVQNVCPIGDIAASGLMEGIAKFGQHVHKDLDAIYGGSTGAYEGSYNNYPAYNGSPEAPGWNGNNIPSNSSDTPTGTAIDSTANQPIIDLPRDLLRLGLMDGGAADDSVYDILINGNDIWVAGAFSRWGNTPCPGLVRLDHLGRLAYDFLNFRAAFTEPVRHLSLTSDGNVMAASTFSSMYQNNRSAPLHKILRDGTEDVTFSPLDQIAINDTAHPNHVIDVACLSDGKVAVLTPRTLTMLASTGAIVSQQDSSNTDMFLALCGVPGTTSVALSSHAWSSPGQPCLYSGSNVPRGFKLLDEMRGLLAIDSAWSNPAYIGLPSLGAGTGAMASCMRAITDPTNSYFIVGNGLTRYNGQDTSWNIQVQGNLFAQSETMSTSSAWPEYGAISVIRSATIPSGVTGNVSSWILDNTGGVGFQAFIQQSVVVAPNVNAVCQFYLLKNASPTAYPIIQMQFAGSSSNAATGGGGGTPIEAYAWIDPSGTNVPLVENVSGAGNPSVTMVTAPSDSAWWFVTMTLTNASSDTDLNVTFFPAYSSTWGGTSTSVAGSIQVSAPELRYDYWSSVYVPTTSTPALPSETSSNSSRFQGLYKILLNGSADPNFNCSMTYSIDDGMAVPFAVDGHGNIYCGGPIASIKDSSGGTHITTPWMLYKLNSNGQFLAQYNMFDDAVLVARITAYGNLVVGGKFQYYGSYSCGRFVMIDPFGNLIRDPELLDAAIFTSSASSYPDVVTLPGLKSKTLEYRWTDPPGLFVWSNQQGKWVQSGVGGYTQLPPVSVTDSPAVPPSLWVPGESGLDGSSPLSLIMSDGIGTASIWYTLDGSDPRILTNGARHLYPANASAGSYPEITQPTIVTAYATAPGYTDSILSTVIFGQQLAPPVIAPSSENIGFPVQVTITTQGGSQIYYTTDGTNPATSGTAVLYSAPFNVGSPGAASAVVMAVAKETGFFTSAVQQANYGDNIIPDIAFTPITGSTLPVALTVGLPASFTAGYSVVYTTSTTGTAPDPIANPSQTTTVQGPLTLNLSVGTSIAAYATSPGWTSSPVATASYGLAIANAPTITLPPAGSGIGTVIITADPTGPAGQTIFYSIDGAPYQSGASPLGIDISDVAGVNGTVTVQAYSTFSGWGNSPSATATAQAILLSGLIDVNFAPSSAAAKVGRMAVYSNPFTDVWNPIGSPLTTQPTLQENFYAGGTGTAQAPGAAAATSLTFSQNTGGTFGVIPFIGDNAYKNFLEIGSVQIATNNFDSVAYGLGLYFAVTSGGQIYTSPDGFNWTLTQQNLPALMRSVAVNIAPVTASICTTTFTYQYPTGVPFSSGGIPYLSAFQTVATGFTLVSATATGAAGGSDTSHLTEGVTIVYQNASGQPANTYPTIPQPPGYPAPSITVTNNSAAAYAALFIVGAGIVMISTDGRTWSNITGNLPSTVTFNDLSVSNVGGSPVMKVVGTGGRQFQAAVATSHVTWSEVTPVANIGANLNSICFNSAGGSTQNQLIVGDAGTIFDVNGSTLSLNAYNETSFSRAAVNPNLNLFAFISQSLNGATSGFTATTGTSPAFTACAAFPSGTTNLWDITAYEYGFIAVGDYKVLYGQMVAGVLTWTDITPTGTGSSSGGSSSGGQVGSFTPTIYDPGSSVLWNFQSGGCGFYSGANIGTEYWPSGWPDTVYWGWTYVSGTSTGTLSFYSDSAGSHLLATAVIVTEPEGSIAINNLSSVQIGEVFIAGPLSGYTTNIPVSSGNAITFAPFGSSSGSSGMGGVEPFLFTGVTLDSNNRVIVCGSQGIIVGSQSGSQWNWFFTSEILGPPAPSTEVLRGTFQNLTPGFYDLLLFGHGNMSGENATFHAYVDGVQAKDTNGVLAPATTTNSNFQNTNWTLDRQYVEFSALETTAGQIAFGVVPTGVSSSTYIIRQVQWIEYGTGSGGFGFIGGQAVSVTYTTSNVNPGVSVGSEITAQAIVSNQASISPTTIAGQTANVSRSATRLYLTGVQSSGSGFINAVQLSRRQGAGARLQALQILPESLDNLPFPKVGSADLVGILLNASDLALGIAPIAEIYYSVVACTYSASQIYAASGATAAGLSADPTPSTGTPYANPFPIADNSTGVLVRAIATCVGRTQSKVAYAYYWPSWPTSSSQGE